MLFKQSWYIQQVNTRASSVTVQDLANLFFFFFFSVLFSYKTGVFCLRRPSTCKLLKTSLKGNSLLLILLFVPLLDVFALLRMLFFVQLFEVIAKFWILAEQGKGVSQLYLGVGEDFVVRMLLCEACKVDTRADGAPHILIELV